MRSLLGLRCTLAVGLAWAAWLGAYVIQQDRPSASLSGRVQAAESGAPLAGVRVSIQSATCVSDKQGRFYFGELSAGLAQLEAHARGRQPIKQRPDRPADNRIVLREGSNYRDIILEKLPPRLDLTTFRTEFTTTHPPAFAISGLASGMRCYYLLYSVREDRSRQQEKDLGKWVSKPARISVPPWLKPTTRVDFQIQPDSDGLFHRLLLLQGVPEGDYAMLVKVDDLEKAARFRVTDLGLIAKQTADSILAYTVDLTNSQPLPNVRLTATDTAGQRAQSVTNAKGLAFFHVPPAPKQRNLVAQWGRSRASVSSWIGEGSREVYGRRIYLYTDRPIYRPGHTVHLKGIVRIRDQFGYHLPQDTVAAIEVRDPAFVKIVDSTLPVTSLGSFTTSFAIPEQGDTGEYGIDLHVGGTAAYDYVEVQEYRKPEFEVSLTPTKKYFLPEENVEVKLSARYFFGAPVANAKVHFWAMVSEEEFGAPQWEREVEKHYGCASEEHYGDLVTNEQGECLLSFKPTRPCAIYHDRSADFEVEVTDAADRTVAETVAVPLVRGDFSLSTNVEPRTTEPFKRVSVIVTAKDHEGAPVPALPVELRRVFWTITGEETEATPPARRGKILAKGTTDSAGVANLSFIPDRSGDWELEIDAKDKAGREIADLASLWVSARAYDDPYYHYSDLELIPDKDKYQVGDTARLVLNTSHPGAYALFTIEGGGLYDYRLMKVTSKSTVLEVPILKEYAPNVGASVCMVYEERFLEAVAPLPVESPEAYLKVAVKSDRTQYQPGDTARYTVETRDGLGNPIAAEASLAVVDEAIFELRKDSTDLAGFFFGPQENEVRTAYSFQTYYLTNADKGGGPEARVRKEFPDTAYWNARVMTDASGKASVSVKLPDSITTWRATAQAHTASSAFGGGLAKVVASKPLLVRLETPRFLVEGDTANVKVVAHNYTGREQQIRAFLSQTGAGDQQFPPAEAVVPDGKEHIADWEVQAKRAGKAIFRATAQGQGYADAMELPVPVLPDGVQTTWGTAGIVASRVSLNVPFPSDATKEDSYLVIRLSPTLADVMLAATKDLADYPYGCVEQTVSRLIPTLACVRTLRALGLAEKDLPPNAEGMITASLGRLSRLCNPDGAWGWWEGEPGDVHMTSYALLGLLLARDAGYQFRKDLLDNGLEWLAQRLAKEYGKAKAGARPELAELSPLLDPLALRPDYADLAFALYVLAKGGEFQSAWVKELLKRRDALPPLSLAYMAETCRLYRINSESPGDADYFHQARSDVIRSIWLAAKKDGPLIYWPEHLGSWDAGSVEVTAMVLRALLGDDQVPERAGRVLNWLLSARQGDGWGTTMNTACALMALDDYLALVPDVTPNYAYTVKLDQQVIASGTVAPDTRLMRPIRVRGDDLEPGSNTLEIACTGTGRPPYSVLLTSYRCSRGLPREENGLAVERKAELVRQVIGETPEGSPSLEFKAEPLPKRIRVGDILKITTRISPVSSLPHGGVGRFVVVEDSFPAGCEPLDREHLPPGLVREPGIFWEAEQQMRDEKAVQFIRYLPAKGVSLTYYVRAQTPGIFWALPAQALQMYRPQVAGHTTGYQLTILPKEGKSR